MRFFLRVFPVLLLAVFLAGVSATASSAWAESVTNVNRPLGPPDTTAFTAVIEDLPLMPGLRPVVEKDVLFVTHSGRIAQTSASGLVDIDEVYYFYMRSLPQLGWKKINARTYERDNEQLRIDVSGVNPKAVTVVRFSVQPLAAQEK